MDADAVHEFPNTYGFKVDRTEVEIALRTTSIVYERKGSFFKQLLFRLYRPVDWMLAELMEEKFQKLYPDIKLYDIKPYE
ncbi:MAG: hypothetical protein HZB66_02345 [Candidatus Aenigmarchaeota archaeon]|nr:hypothetical protein [Candidatus Aenigmarchaeota archaeon]